MKVIRVCKWLVVVAVMMLMPLTVHAGVDYCSTDPILNVNGELQNILVGVPGNMLQYINGPVEVSVIHPSGVPAEIVFIDNSLFEYRVTLKAGTAWSTTKTNYLKVGIVVPTVSGAPNFPVQLIVENSLQRIEVIGNSRSTTDAQLRLN
jgi:hypothetical protein